MSITRFIDEEITNESREYFERERIRDVFESIMTGITYNKPEDPLAFMEDCIQKIRANELLAAKAKLRWDTFLPPIQRPSYSHKRDSIVVRKKLNQVVGLPSIPAGNGSAMMSGAIAADAPRRGSMSKRSTTMLPPISHAASMGQNATEGALRGAPLPQVASSGASVAQRQHRGRAWSNIVFVLGGPGSGKGTQCVRLAKEFNYAHLSAGDLLREEVATGSELGKQLNVLMKEGKIVPMNVTLRLLRSAMERVGECDGFLVDGFPRQLDQAIAFEDQVAKCKFVLFFDCQEAVLEQRLLERGKTSGRADDNMETIKKRFKTFTDASYPVVEHFMRLGRCIKISSEPPADEVYEEARKHFGEHLLYHPNIVFVLGGPGSGKGTQCERLAKEFKLTHLSTGDLLRAEVEKMSEIGKVASDLMKEGRIVPMELMLTLLRNEIERSINSPGFLIDGFPRAMDQAIEFERTIGPCRVVVAFQCSLEVLESRLLERGKTSGRADDNLETIRKRFITFNDQSLPVVDYYKKKGKCIEISSERPIDVVYNDARHVFIPPKPLHHPNIVFVLGGPGSGKGTQCARLARTFNLTHISTGDLLRREVQNKSPVGLLVSKCMQEGGMAPINIVMDLLVREIINNFSSPGFLIDGFPRAMDQALEFERVVGKPHHILFYHCPLEVLELRLVERGKTSGRADDTIDTIRQRFVTYQTESMPVIHYYDLKKAAIKISSIPTPDEVFETSKACFSYLNTKLPFDGQTIIFVLGGPGSGKGTQCDRLVEHLKFAHLSTGDLLRDEVKKGTPLGAKLEADMKEGKMVPVEITMDLLLSAMEAQRGCPGYLVDGFPRTIEQAHLFESKIGRCTFVLYFEASNEVLTGRLLKRGETSGRADDNIESIKKRLVTFEEASMPVINYYDRTGRVRKVNSEGHVDDVTTATFKCFESLA
ncbi:adenylate kinase-domain-containing protein [Entophlyctis helioformis]|nr:adenylate kinase-domain-containing protein [Entophlyctis helioformis]